MGGLLYIYAYQSTKAHHVDVIFKRKQSGNLPVIQQIDSTFLLSKASLIIQSGLNSAVTESDFSIVSLCRKPFYRLKYIFVHFIIW